MTEAKASRQKRTSHSPVVHERPAPKKSLSQNFLIHEAVVQDILEAVGDIKAGTLVECGVGKGALTLSLAQKYKHIPLVGVDIDARCITHTQHRLKHVSQVSLYTLDLLSDAFFQMLKTVDDPLTFVGNLPYHISSQVMIRLIQVWPRTARMVFMFQKEFAQRLRANPAEEAFGKLSVLFQCFYDIRKAVSLNPSSFFPRPSVQSEVLVFAPLEKPHVPFENIMSLTRFLSMAFMHRRKTLRYNLKKVLGPKHLDVIRDVLAQENITLDHRAEIVPIPLWGQISEALVNR
jgi:16S rRNA (adenine1518-N6/adenine1519-N6)-dimethyltransferase